MVYETLPPVGAYAAPELDWHPSPNRSSRHGAHVTTVWNHVWGGGTFQGVIDWLSSPRSQASAHVVFDGGAGGHAAQLVAWGEKAWTECSFNAHGISIESNDAIWQGSDEIGFARLARLTALLLHLHALPPRWVRGADLLHGGRGHTRHADGGTLACGHFSCPTRDLALFGQFHERVVAEHRHGGFRERYGRP